MTPFSFPHPPATQSQIFLVNLCFSCFAWDCSLDTIHLCSCCLHCQHYFLVESALRHMPTSSWMLIVPWSAFLFIDTKVSWQHNFVLSAPHIGVGLTSWRISYEASPFTVEAWNIVLSVWGLSLALKCLWFQDTIWDQFRNNFPYYPTGYLLKVNLASNN